jgi:hypothetical protein
LCQVWGKEQARRQDEGHDDQNGQPGGQAFCPTGGGQYHHFLCAGEFGWKREQFAPEQTKAKAIIFASSIIVPHLCGDFYPENAQKSMKLGYFFVKIHPYVS